MEEKTPKDKDELNEREEELKQEFKDLSKEQRELLAYRKIAESEKLRGLSQSGENQKENLKEFQSLVKAADIGFLKPLIVSAMSDYKSQFQDIYKESLVHYNHILENYGKLAKELKLDSSLDLSHLFTYMLWNGYFSVTKEHSYQLQNRLLLPGMFSFDVIKGRGVCLAYAELLNNYLSVCNKNSSVLCCQIPTGKDAISFDYRPEIKRNEDSNMSSKFFSSLMSLFLGGLSDKFGNHAITLVEEDGELYAYDPTNLFALNIEDSSTASIINGKGNFKLNPLATFITDPDTDPNHIYEKLLLGNNEPALTRKEFIFSFENLIELANGNISLLDDAYANIYSDLVFIDKQTDEIGGYIKALRKIRNDSKKNS